MSLNPQQLARFKKLSSKVARELKKVQGDHVYTLLLTNFCGRSHIQTNLKWKQEGTFPDELMVSSK